MEGVLPEAENLVSALPLASNPTFMWKTQVTHSFPYEALSLFSVNVNLKVEVEACKLSGHPATHGYTLRLCLVYRIGQNLVTGSCTPVAAHTGLCPAPQPTSGSKHLYTIRAICLFTLIRHCNVQNSILQSSVWKNESNNFYDGLILRGKFITKPLIGRILRNFPIFRRSASPQKRVVFSFISLSVIFILFYLSD